MATIFERKFHVRCIVGNISLVMHGEKLEEGNFRNLLPVFDEVLYEDGKTQKLIELGEKSEMKNQHAESKKSFHGLQRYCMDSK